MDSKENGHHTLILSLSGTGIPARLSNWTGSIKESCWDSCAVERECFDCLDLKLQYCASVVDEVQCQISPASWNAIDSVENVPRPVSKGPLFTENHNMTETLPSEWLSRGDCCHTYEQRWRGTLSHLWYRQRVIKTPIPSAETWKLGVSVQKILNLLKIRIWASSEPVECNPGLNRSASSSYIKNAENRII